MEEDKIRRIQGILQEALLLNYINEISEIKLNEKVYIISHTLIGKNVPKI